MLGQKFEISGYYTVFGHGALGSKTIGARSLSHFQYTAAQVAAKIVADPEYRPGESVAVVGCETGATDADHPISFSADLAKELVKLTHMRTTVWAPTQKIQLSAPEYANGMRGIPILRHLNNGYFKHITVNP